LRNGSEDSGERQIAARHSTENDGANASSTFPGTPFWNPT